MSTDSQNVSQPVIWTAPDAKAAAADAMSRVIGGLGTGRGASSDS